MTTGICVENYEERKLGKFNTHRKRRKQENQNVENNLFEQIDEGTNTT